MVHLHSNTKETWFKVDILLCTGCRSCELACSFNFDGLCDPTVSKIKITRDNEAGEVFVDLPLYCPECSFEVEPPCVEACASGALIFTG